MAQFVKDNLIPILLAALLTVSGYLIERTIVNTASIEHLNKDVQNIRITMREIYKHLDAKIIKE